ncbi:MAG: VWA domain-containing protein, partial [bacterium]|nr:VWA domain-containing protein [bacterium]
VGQRLTIKTRQFGLHPSLQRSSNQLSTGSVSSLISPHFAHAKNKASYLHVLFSSMMKKIRQGNSSGSFLLPGYADAYILVLLVMVCVLSFFLAGGLSPRLVANPEDAQSVQIADASRSGQLNTLQLFELQAASGSAPIDLGCLKTAGIFLLLDESNSMRLPLESPKIDAVKVAAKAFLANLPPSTLVGLYVFSSPTPHGDPRELVPLEEYASNGTQLDDAIDSITPDGSTYMNDGFVLLRDKIQDARQLYPGSQFFVIFLSDGLPAGTDQDPLQVVSEIKQFPLNGTIFSIALDSSGTALMTEIASDPKEKYFLQSPTSSEIRGAYNLIASRLCQ